MEERFCGTCGRSFPDTDDYFSHYKGAKGIMWGWCKLCAKEARLKKYGLSVKDWQLLFDKQEGKCAICGKHQSELSVALAVDHNHVTGKIRGLLCTKCNTGLGCYNSDEEHAFLLKKAVLYLEGL